MLADACVASSHCSATRTVTFDYFYIAHSDEEIWHWYDIEEFIRFSALLLWAAGRQCLVSWLVACVCQLTCCCPPTVHINPHRQRQRTSAMNVNFSKFKKSRLRWRWETLFKNKYLASAVSCTTYTDITRQVTVPEIHCWLMARTFFWHLCKVLL